MTPDEARRLLDGTTPGPWVRWRDADGNPTPVVVSAGPTDRRHIMTAEPAASPERQQADTALIAADPGMTAMVAGMREEWGVKWDDDPHGPPDWGFTTRAAAEQWEKKHRHRGPGRGHVVRRFVTKPEEA